VSFSYQSVRHVALLDIAVCTFTAAVPCSAGQRDTGTGLSRITSVSSVSIITPMTQDGCLISEDEGVVKYTVFVLSYDVDTRWTRFVKSDLLYVL
jgi:hypothetical protein